MELLHQGCSGGLAARFPHPLVGITGSFGRTSVLMMLEAILRAADRRIGAIGSELVGIRLQGAFEAETSFTTPDASLVVTRSLGAAGELDRVEEEEYQAFLAGLCRSGLSWEERDELEEAVTSALERAQEGDLVVLLGAQGMDAGAAVLERWRRRARVPA